MLKMEGGRKMGKCTDSYKSEQTQNGWSWRRGAYFPNFTFAVPQLSDPG